MAPEYERLVELAYDAPLTSDGWRPFLTALCEATNSHAGGIKWMAYAPDRFHMVSIGFDTTMLRLHAERYGLLDAWAQIPLPADADLYGDEFLPRAELEATEFYQDFCRRYDIHDIHKIMLVRTPERQVSIGLLKPAHATGREEERQLTRRLTPHVRRALSLAGRIADSEAARGALSEALDLASAAVFFLDARGGVRFSTSTADRLAARKDGLVITGGHLHAVHPDDDHQLAAHLAGTTDAPAAIIRRGPGLVPYRVFAVPRPRGTDHEIAMLAIVTEAPTSQATEAVLRHGYALTSPEVRVALRIGRSLELPQIAEELELPEVIVAAQLAEVYAKTGVRGPAELVELLARLQHDS